MPVIATPPSPPPPQGELGLLTLNTADTHIPTCSCTHTHLSSHLYGLEALNIVGQLVHQRADATLRLPGVTAAGLRGEAKSNRRCPTRPEKHLHLLISPLQWPEVFF